jgi:ACS family glucarate transporter-like MFS transporter
MIPSRTRHWVILLAITLAVITYIDRVCISQAKGAISSEFNLNAKQMGYVFSAFTLAYALFEIPGGWLGDWLGPRKVLMRVVVWWSFFTAATGWVWSYSSLLATRFLFGMGEAGCFPNLTKIFSVWLPQDERVRAQGITWMCARWGGALTPFLVVWVMTFMSWRKAFMLFGALGVVWAVGFYIWFRDNPRDHASVNSAELALLKDAEQNASGHGDVPWATMLRSPTVWLLWFQYFCLSYGWYFYITWLPTYLKEGRGLTGSEQARLAGLPLFFGGLGCLVAGIVSARLLRWLGTTARTRRTLGVVGFTAAAGLLMAAAYIWAPTTAMVAMGLASFANDLTMPGSWGACMDVGGKYAGTLSGSMNMMGNLGGAVSGVVGGYILDAQPGGWIYIFYANTVIYVLGACCWFFIDPVTPLEKAAPGPPETRHPTTLAS